MKITKKCIMALASVVMLVLQAFDIKFDVPMMNEIVSAAASFLVMIGIVGDSSKTLDKSSDETEFNDVASKAFEKKDEDIEQQKSEDSTENQEE